MITIRATSLYGQPPCQPLACEFDETGGAIGRATNNRLVFPDPERHSEFLRAYEEQVARLDNQDSIGTPTNN